MTPRESFNTLVATLGLTVDHTASDGWHRAFHRPDGLHLWRAFSFRDGLYIQTAWIDAAGHYCDHRPYLADGDIEAALRLAAGREARA
jgi:hypothetical protein